MDQIRVITYQLLLGLRYIHSAGVCLFSTHEQFIHRDVKPGNVLLTSSGGVAGWIFLVFHVVVRLRPGTCGRDEPDELRGHARLPRSGAAGGELGRLAEAWRLELHEQGGHLGVRRGDGGDVPRLLLLPSRLCFRLAPRLPTRKSCWISSCASSEHRVTKWWRRG